MLDRDLGLNAPSAGSKPPSPVALNLDNSMKEIFLDIQRHHGGQVPAFSSEERKDGMRVKYIKEWYAGLATRHELTILRDKTSDMGECRHIVDTLDNLLAAQIKEIFTKTGDGTVPKNYKTWGDKGLQSFTSSSSTLENFLKKVKKRDNAVTKGKDLIDRNFPISDTAKLAQSLAAFRQRHGA